MLQPTRSVQMMLGRERRLRRCHGIPQRVRTNGASVVRAPLDVLCCDVSADASFYCIRGRAFRVGAVEEIPMVSILRVQGCGILVVDTPEAALWVMIETLKGIFPIGIHFPV